MLATLNPEQRRAVEHGEGPLLVVAGAGTGKTKVITHRIAHLIAEKRARPDEILALTFTDKAAAEMEERVDLLVPYGWTDVWISTFHSFGDRLLRQHALELGLPPDFRVLTRAEQVIFLRETLFDVAMRYFRPLGDPTRHLSALITLISRAKDEDVDPAAYARFAESLGAQAAETRDAALSERAEREAEVARVYAHYQREMGRRGFVDFGDQVIRTLQLLREHPLVRDEAQQRFLWILVDELQDTNYAQYQLVRMIAGERRNLSAVGDDDQSIYRFRGAALSNILNFTRDYPEATEIVLTRNYRSTQPILDAAYRLIRYNDPDRLEVKNGIVKRLSAVAPAGDPEPPQHRHFDTHDAEADGVAEAIAERLRSGSSRARDMAILVRGNADADPYLRALNMRAIPYRFSGGAGLYERSEVRTCLSYLRVLADPDDSVSLFHLAGSELYSLRAEDLLRLNRIAAKQHRPLWWALTRRTSLPGLEDREAVTEAGLTRLVDDVRAGQADVPRRSSGEVLYEFLRRTGLLAQLAEGTTLAGEERAQNIAKFFQILRSTGRVLRRDVVPAMVGHLDLLIDAGDDPAAADIEWDADAVRVLTVHKSKGLEFPHVWLVSLVSDRFPTRSKGDPIPFPVELLADREVLLSSEHHAQEERRLFYVGMTRARRTLTLTSSRDWGGKRPKKISPFVLEALDLPKAEPTARSSSAIEQLRRNAPPPPEVDVALPPIPDDELLTLSHYQLDDYSTCPLKYKYVHVLRVPILRHHSVVYGAALHAAIEAYNRARAKGGSITEDELFAVFERAWVSEGFVHRQHEELRFEAGKQALRRFREREEASVRRPSHVEREFAVVVGRNRVIGRYDRVDEQTDGGAIVLDYKSSDVTDPEKAQEKADESLQLTIYALAWSRTAGRLPDRVELHFLESGLVGSSSRTEKDLTDLESRIETVSKRIRARDYAATPGYQVCRFCAYRDICPATAVRP